MTDKAARKTNSLMRKVVLFLLKKEKGFGDDESDSTLK